MAKQSGTCDKHQQELSERGKCWSCQEEAEASTKAALVATLSPEQRVLFDAYHEAASARTSEIILD
ncbi:MAG: hypothetical protein AAB921_00305 [Patescibacteria group bacterium]